MTSTLSLYRSLNPRMLIAHELALICATLTPGTTRRRSGILLVPERRISSSEITKIAAPVLETDSSLRETEVTRIFIRSSRLAPAKPLEADVEGWAPPGTGASSARVNMALSFIFLKLSFIKAGPACRDLPYRPNSGPGIDLPGLEPQPYLH